MKKDFPKKIPINGRVRICVEMVKKQKVTDNIVVNIGSSFGWLEKEIQILKPERLIGIEINQEAVKFARQNVPGVGFLVGDALDLPLESNLADLAFLFDVLEHVPKGTEHQALKETNRVLKKGGILLLSTPNSHPVSNILDLAWYFGHRHYSKDKISKLLKKAGFKITYIESKGNIFSSLYLTWFYICKILFRINQPRNVFFEKVDDQGYKNQGITDIFLVAQKVK